MGCRKMLVGLLEDDENSLGEGEGGYWAERGRFGKILFFSLEVLIEGDGEWINRVAGEEVCSFVVLGRWEDGMHGGFRNIIGFFSSLGVDAIHVVETSKYIVISSYPENSQ